ncbi:hypothetical protein [Alicyclobacillus fastidiosus]|uniref:Uncharacterized protein n=1 Tax=Alicyclobacillus fastidiosus TaxID=392011 RepID=A0ABV5AFU0_9BACL|nr:hypothetical protein [Alicyclobacillus fastidiosus]WEH09683.1 hypothetical protein PYS47_24105 [Alicyclobacillus fastidiosus]
MWDAVFYFDPLRTQDQVIHYLRLPRAIAGAFVGAPYSLYLFAKSNQ